MAKNNLEDKARCRFVAADGRRCSLPRAQKHQSLCINHWRREQEFADAHNPEADALVARFLGAQRDFRTTTAVNLALGDLFSLLARKQIAPRTAAILTYIAQLLLQTIENVRFEFMKGHSHYSEWDAVVQQTLSETDELRARKLAPARPRREA